jgi:hypothetical protein
MLKHVKNHDERAAMTRLLQKYAVVFPEELPDGLPPDRGTGHTIPLVDGAQPQWRHVYRLSPAEKAEAQKQIIELLAKGWIQPSKSPYGSSILFVTKKDGTLRMCVDYRALNKNTVKNRFPLPRIDDLLDVMHGSNYFTSLDLASAYHQVRITDEDVPKTAFNTPFGHYEFKVLCFGLSNAPATFQSQMNKIFGSMTGRCMVVYLDDVLIFSKTFEEHLQHVEQAMKILQDNQYYAKLKKCEFCKEEVKYLGHVVGKGGVKVDAAKVAAVQDWPRPKDAHELRQFLGLTNYFRRFILAYSAVAKPLTDCLKTSLGVRMLWSAECEAAFQLLKDKLVQAPVLTAPDFAEDAAPFEIISDASAFAIGAVLMQGGRPIAFESRKLNAAEQGYHTTDREFLGVVHALRTWRCYVEGAAHPVVLVTDHNPLVGLQAAPALTGKQLPAVRRQARWLEELQRFHVTWQYRPGRTNVADPLSRCPTYAGHDVVESCSYIAAVTRQKQTPPTQNPAVQEGMIQEIQKAYAADAWFSNEANTSKLDFSQQLWWKAEAVAVPDSSTIKQAIMAEFHDTPYSGHCGTARTTRSISRYYWWPNMATDVAEFVKTCSTCQRNKPSQQKQAGLLQPLSIPDRKWSSVSMDFVVTLPVTAAGHTAMMVMVDRMSKMAHIAPCTDEITAEEAARIFLHEVVRLHGMPVEVITDRGSQFTSGLWKELCKIWEVKQCISTSFHPQTDGQTERMNRIIEDMIRHFVGPQHDDWDRHLDAIEFAINDAWQESIQTTPFMLNYGQHPRRPGVPRPDMVVKNMAAEDFAIRQRKAEDTAKVCMEAAQQRQKSYADQHRKEVQFSVGEQVLLNTKNIKLKNPGKRKLLPKFIGPFPILEKVGPVAYKLQLPAKWRIHNVFHVALLKQFNSSARSTPPPPPIEIDEELEYEVEFILLHRDSHRCWATQKVTGCRREFLIKWSGYGPEHNTWEPEANLTHCQELIDNYLQAVPVSDDKAAGKKRKRRLAVV